ncbi:putative esterase KAI2 [Ananas comosus]|uniref:Putative esterase KAI2 n=1 Tax=Ananas comosus TaxID=4615 RepID=A0A199UQJ6_ANACO|nr:putative esterase KAI2 [Ananas comosus]
MAAMSTNVTMVGSGEKVVVLAHGYGGNQAVWDGLVPHLSKNYRILLFDWDFSGNGSDVDPSSYSFTAYADDLITLMDERNLNDAVYIGHSMAGMIGCIASIKRRDLFAHLVLIAASPRYLNSEDYVGGFEKEDVDGILSSIETNFQDWALKFVPVAIDAGSKLLHHEARCRIGRRKNHLLGDHRDVLDEVDVPCTIIQTTDDFAVPVSVGQYMQSKIREASLEIIEAGGHFPQLTTRDLVIEILDGVLPPINAAYYN